MRWRRVEPEPNHGPMVYVNVQIRHNPTKVVRELLDQTCNVTDGDVNPFIWSDGNCACDCNRGLFFAEAADEPDPDHACGHDVYSVRLLNPVDGEMFYSDFEDEELP